jgi:membrane-associated protease RseP (regulator of RpoE activity)
LTTVIAFIVIFGALVFFHELGHLIFAKRAGILCREFAIGFGPKVLSFMKNETVYTIRLLPIGGFVRMAGEDPEMVEIKPGYRVGLVLDHEDKVQKLVLNNKDKFPNALIMEVEHADIEHDLVIKGDFVQSIDDVEISSWLDVVEVIRENPDHELTFYVERNGETLKIPVTPQVNKLEDGQTIGLIGVYSPTEKSPLKAVQYGATETYFWTKAIFAAVGKLVTGQFTIDALSGPVGIYQSTDMVAQNGIFYLMRWAGMLSINLGIMNLLPIPALDGGRLLFFAVEAVRGKPIDRQKEGMIHFLGFALLMLLMLVVTWNDIQRFFL